MQNKEISKRERARIRMEKLRKERVANGLCPCGSEKETNRYRCNFCIYRQANNKRRLKEEGKLLLRIKDVKNYTLYNRMIELNISTSMLAEMVEVTPRTIQRLIRTNAIPLHKTCLAINQALDKEIY